MPYILTVTSPPEARGAEPSDTVTINRRAVTQLSDAVIDLGGEGGRYWFVMNADATNDDARSAAIYARASGSVGGSYNDARVQRLDGPLSEHSKWRIVLPDGSIVKVEEANLYELSLASGFDHVTAVIAAFNAANSY